MKAVFLGATHEVTGSITYLEAGKHKFLVDCGMEQGKDIFVNQDIPVNASEIEAVFLTHAHVDHSGNLPLLYKRGFRGNVYATEATANLCAIMLLDCANIQEKEAEWKNRKSKRAGRDETEPIYTMDDAKEAIKRFIPVEYGKRVQVEENCEICFRNAGHLLGAASIEIWLTENRYKRKIVFSGDIGNANRPLICDPEPPEEADYVVIESTYGNRLHPQSMGKRAYIDQLAEIIDRTMARGGNVVIPSFAVGRTQELLFFLREIKAEGMVKSVPDFRVFVDSPLAVEATNIFLQTPPEYFAEEVREILLQGENPIFFDGLNVAVTTDESIAINTDPGPKVILSASGMCEAGRIRHHLKHNLWRKESTICFAGYQTEGTLGRALQDGATTVKLFSEDIAVNAEIATLEGTSGHADKEGLVAWLTGMKKKPKMVFVNHGDDEVVTSFSELLSDGMGYITMAPYSGTEFDLVAGKVRLMTEGIPVRPEEAASEKAEGIFGKLKDALSRLQKLVSGMRDNSNKELEALTGEIDALTEKFANWEDPDKEEDKKEKPEEKTEEK